MPRFLSHILLACCLLTAAGEAVSAPAVPRRAFPLLQGAGVRTLSASAKVTLAWLQEGERRSWFPELPADAVVVRMNTVLLLAPVSATATVLVQPAPVSGTGRSLIRLGSVDGKLAVEPSGEGRLLTLHPGSQAEVIGTLLFALERLPQGGKRGAGKAAYHLDLALDLPAAGACVPQLDLDLGRKVSARLIKTVPPRLSFKAARTLRWCSDGGPDAVLGVEVSDAVLKAYPPMTLAQRDASKRLVEEFAHGLGRLK
jgi:hypothetical protein